MKKRFTVDRWLGVLRSGRKFYSIADLMKMSGLGHTACRAAAARLVKRSLLVRVRKELFGNALAGFTPEEAACLAHAPSYLSCEYALSRHGVVDQMPIALTAVTLNRGKRMRIGATVVVYRHLRKNLFWGYEAEGDALIADAEKALLDWLYLTGKGGAARGLDEINWDQLNRKRLEAYVQRFPREARRRLERTCLRTMEDAGA